MGRDEFRHPLKFCAPEILCPAQGITPVNGGLGADSPCQGEMARRARGGRESRHGERSSPLRRPPASYGSFSTWKRNSPRRAKPCKTRRRGHGPGQLLLPLRGNSPSAPALRGSSNDACSLKRPPHPSPLGPPSPQGEGGKEDGGEINRENNPQNQRRMWKKGGNLMYLHLGQSGGGAPQEHFGHLRPGQLQLGLQDPGVF